MKEKEKSSLATLWRQIPETTLVMHDLSGHTIIPAIFSRCVEKKTESGNPFYWWLLMRGKEKPHLFTYEYRSNYSVLRSELRLLASSNSSFTDH